eukprot:TRINITY_DN1874_c0_g1_i3.p1 TRINITY_DN1874_c0_g1~~TRINITY_DN1874_c0_g1_i3.p1  ORF type:complete len:360 (+),score=60.81 TRINITY_DN1874_c0_g1_i3:383-1462(+)
MHKLLLGTQTSDGDPNYLMVAKVRLPNEEALRSLGDFQNNNKDPGGIGLAGSDSKLFEIETRIPHDREVNRVRCMPQKYQILASQTCSGEVHIFDYHKHSSKPSEAEAPRPDLRLQGQKQEGYGLAWGPKKEGYLATASYDGSAYVFNVEGNAGSSTAQPLVQLVKHTGPVEDISWNRYAADVLASVADDNHVCLWDLRKGQTPTVYQRAHLSEINSIDFNPFNEYLFITGSSDNTVKTWDLRNLEKCLHTFEGHKSPVQRVEWSPHNGAIFCSSADDRSVIVWDMSRIGAEVRQEELQDGPPELMFKHAGHRGRIPDLSWHPLENMVLASVEEDNNVVQVWQMNYAIYQDDDLDIKAL